MNIQRMSLRRFILWIFIGSLPGFCTLWVLKHRIWLWRTRRPRDQVQSSCYRRHLHEKLELVKVARRVVSIETTLDLFAKWMSCWIKKAKPFPKETHHYVRLAVIIINGTSLHLKGHLLRHVICYCAILKVTAKSAKSAAQHGNVEHIQMRIWRLSITCKLSTCWPERSVREPKLPTSVTHHWWCHQFWHIPQSKAVANRDSELNTFSKKSGNSIRPYMIKGWNSIGLTQ